MPGRLAVVTGATAGIGAAFARQLIAGGYELILVARDPERLGALGAELAAAGGRCTWLSADLTTDAGCAAVVATLTDDGRPVDLLVNNAGFGLRVPLTRTAVADEERLLALNVQAVLRLTHAALGPMLARGSGQIINVSSVAGFAPLAPGSTYPASKAWVTSFSESVDQLARRGGVRVMALCPGYTRTEFHDRAGIPTGEIPGWLWLNADTVVTTALRDARRGRSVSIPSLRYRFVVILLRHVPRSWLARLAGGWRARSGVK